MLTRHGDNSLANAQWFFEKIFKTLTGLDWASREARPLDRQYTFVQVNYRGLSSSDIVSPHSGSTQHGTRDSKISKRVQKLLTLIFTLPDLSSPGDFDFGFDASKFGRLSRNTLFKGYNLLSQISECIQRDGPRAELERLTNKYYGLIPHVWGSHPPVVMTIYADVRSEVRWIDDLIQMNYTSELLQAAMSVKDRRTHELDLKLQMLGVGLTPLDNHKTEYVEIKNYLMRSAPNRSTEFTLGHVFRVDRPEEQRRLPSSQFSSGANSSRRLLWHGSRNRNFVGILRQGLRIAPPEAPHSGALYGRGAFPESKRPAVADNCPFQAFTLLTLQKNPFGTVTTTVRRSFCFCAKSTLVRVQQLPTVNISLPNGRGPAIFLVTWLMFACLPHTLASMVNRHRSLRAVLKVISSSTNTSFTMRARSGYVTSYE